MNELFEQVRKQLGDYCANEQHMVLLESEIFDLWEVATRSCRAEIKRLERLLAFQVRGRIADVEERNNAISAEQSESPNQSIEAPPYQMQSPA